MGLLASDKDVSEMRRLMDIVSNYNDVEYPNQEEMEISSVEAKVDPKTKEDIMIIRLRKK